MIVRERDNQIHREPDGARESWRASQSDPERESVRAEEGEALVKRKDLWQSEEDVVHVTGLPYFAK